MFLRVGMRESSSPAAQHFCSLLQSHVNLVTYRDKALRQVVIVFAQQVHSNEDVVDVSEDQSPFLCIAVFALDKCYRVISPVATRVQVVRSVVPIVKGVSIALNLCKHEKSTKDDGKAYRNIN